MKSSIVSLLMLLLIGCSTQTATKQEDTKSTQQVAPANTSLDNPNVEYTQGSVPESALDSKSENLPMLLTKVDPAYPEGALQSNVEGDVLVQALIVPSGKVRTARIAKSDNDTFNRAALEAAIQWTFQPPKDGETPIAVWVTIPFRFRLSK